MIRTGRWIVKAEEVMAAIENIDGMRRKPLNTWVLWVGHPVRQSGCHRRLMSEATYPAPKPLSILTTVTLEAHEFIMPSSAAMPWKAAP